MFNYNLLRLCSKNWSSKRLLFFACFKRSFLSCVGRDYFLYADVDYNCYHDVDDVTNLIDDYACRNKFSAVFFVVTNQLLANWIKTKQIHTCSKQI